MLDVAGNGGLLPAIRVLMSKIYVPTIQAMTNWGRLTETPHGKKTKESFVHSVENFVHYLDSKNCLHYMIVLTFGSQRAFVEVEISITETRNERSDGREIDVSSTGTKTGFDSRVD